MTVTNDIKYIGVNDTKTDLFEGQYNVPNGISYNSYVVIDKKIAVLDTVDKNFGEEWLDNLSAALDERTPDYLIVQHMEPDHSASIEMFMSAYPCAKIIASQKAFSMMNGFFGTDYADRRAVVDDGEVLHLGKHDLKFITAPMVHWPEVIMTYDSTAKVLFSADAFGKFGIASANEPWDDEARRYYIGIVGKYGAQVQALLKKTAALNIEKICPLHGPVLKENLDHYISLYNKWSSYVPEETGTVIAYASIYGNTAKAAELLCEKIREAGGRVELFDLARCDLSFAVAAAFKYSNLVLASSTYNGGVFPPMREFILALTDRNYSERTVGFIENGTWAPMAAKTMRTMLNGCKGIAFADPTVKIMSSLSDKNLADIEALKNEIVNCD